MLSDRLRLEFIVMNAHIDQVSPQRLSEYHPSPFLEHLLTDLR